jgi:hypothetical protein
MHVCKFSIFNEKDLTQSSAPYWDTPVYENQFQNEPSRTTSILTSSSTCLCPRNVLKSNRNPCQNPTGILTKVSPNFLFARKKEALRGFRNPTPLSDFFKSHNEQRRNPFFSTGCSCHDRWCSKAKSGIVEGLPAVWILRIKLNDRNGGCSKEIKVESSRR